MTPRTTGSAGAFVGVDIGGTKIAVALVDDRARLLATARRPTPATDVDRLVCAIGEAVADACRKAEIAIDAVRCIGIGAPGRVDPGRGLWSGSTNLRFGSDLPLVRRVQQLTGRTTILENDVRVAAFGAFRDAPLNGATLVFLSVGTGLAAAVVRDRALLVGEGEAGEIGHVPIEPSGYPCACGRIGCLETLASGRALERWAAASRDHPEPGTEQGRHLRSLDVVAAARRGEAWAGRLVDRLADGLVLAVHVCHRAYDPARLVIGGGLGIGAWDLLEPAIVARLGTVDAHVARRLERAAQGEHAGALGAAAYAASSAADAAPTEADHA